MSCPYRHRGEMKIQLVPIRNPVLEGLLGATRRHGKSRPGGFDPWIVEPVASRYIDYAIPEFIYIHIHIYTYTYTHIIHDCNKIFDMVCHEMSCHVEKIRTTVLYRN